MNINGTTNLRFNKVGKVLLWSCSVSSQNQDGTTTWANIPVTLSKKVEDEVKKLFKEATFKNDKDKYITIDITKGFLSCYKNKENKSVVKIVVTEIKPYTPKEKKVETDEVEIPF